MRLRVVLDGLDPLRCQRREHDVGRHGVLLDWVLCPFYRTSAADAVFIPAMFLRSIFLGAACSRRSSRRPLRAAPEPTEPLKPCYVAAQETSASSSSSSGTASRRSTMSTSSSTTSCSRPPSVAAATATSTGQASSGAVQSRPAQRDVHAAAGRADNPTNTVTATSMVTRAVGRADADGGHDRQRVRFRGRGFTGPARARLRALRVRAASRARRSGSGSPKGDLRDSSTQAAAVPVQEEPAASASGRSSSTRRRSTTRRPQSRVPMTIKVSRRIKPKQARAR